MYYCLKPGVSLCSWKGLPYGIRNETDGHTSFLHDSDLYMLLYRCNGKTDFDTLALTKAQRQELAQMESEGLLIPYPEAHPLDGPIPSHIYSNRYRTSVHWSITGQCNYHCRHCFQSAAKGTLGQPTLEQLLDIIDQFAACGIRDVSITGGEPLIRPDLFEIIDALTEHNIHLSTIYSNGALVNDTLIKNLQQRGLKPSFQISFDGVGWHDWMRGVPGAEEMAIRAIRLLKANGFNVGCALALCQENAPSLLKTAQMLESLGCNALKVQRCIPQGEWRMEQSHYLSNDELMEIYMQFAEQLCTSGVHMSVQMEGIYMVSWDKIPQLPEKQIPEQLTDQKEPDVKPGQEIQISEPRYFISVLCDHETEQKDFTKLPSCGVTWSSFFVGPNGAVVPCMSMCGAAVESIFPNLWDIPLKNILTDSAYTKYSEVKRCHVIAHNTECRECTYRFRCVGGPCRAMAIGDNKTDYLCHDEFTCYLFRSGWITKLKQKADEILEKTLAYRNTEKIQNL